MNCLVKNGREESMTNGSSKREGNCREVERDSRSGADEPNQEDVIIRSKSG